MNRTLRATCAVMTVAFLNQPIMAWDGFGHMAVASVAYRNLDAATRARVDKLIDLRERHLDRIIASSGRIAQVLVQSLVHAVAHE